MHVLCAGPVLAPGVVVPIGVPVVPSVGGVDRLAPVAKHSGKEHHSNQDGVGDNEDQHKNETDDAVHFGLLQFVVLLLAEGLRGERRGREVCVWRGGGGTQYAYLSRNTDVCAIYYSPIYSRLWLVQDRRVLAANRGL